MATRRRQRFVHGVVAWLLGWTLFLVVFDALAYDLFFVGAFVGLLVVFEFTAPFAVTPVWRRRLWWLVGAGAAVVAAIALGRALEIVGLGVG